VAVAKVDEDQPAVVSAALHPTSELDLGADVIRAEVATKSCLQHKQTGLLRAALPVWMI
jgi:hypothetical protein